MSQNPWGPAHSSPSPLSNNPFIDDPSAAHNRYPALEQTGSGAQYTGAAYGSLSPGMLGYQLQQQLQPTGTDYYPSPGGYGAAPGPSGGAYPTQLQPVATGYFSPAVQSPAVYSPSFSQSPYAGAGYGSGFPQPQQQQQWQPQAANTAPQHLQQFDPLNPQAQQQQLRQLQPLQQPAWGPSPGQSMNTAYDDPNCGGLPQPRADDHPRRWILSHKNELEIWDPVTWKQAFIRFDELQSHWERRKSDIQMRVDAAMRGYIPPQEGPMWQNLLNETNSHIDTVAAAKFQMKEVLEGYKQSSDPASKRRVREFLNAGLSSLPDWPPPN